MLTGGQKIKRLKRGRKKKEGSKKCEHKTGVNIKKKEIHK